MNLTYDTARCSSTECPKRQDCARRTYPGREQWQAVTDFYNKTSAWPCVDFISNSGLDRKHE